MNRQRLLVLAAAVAALLGTWASAGTAAPALAASAPGRDTVDRGDGSALTLRFDRPMSAADATAVASALAQPPADAAGGPNGQLLVCNQFHRFTDSNGSWTFQHRCGGTTGPWGYQINAGLCAIAISPVSESGMQWTRNGRRMPRQAPHPNVFCRYQFHGTYNPEHDFDVISYNDHFTFRVEVGGQTGTANLDIHGTFYSAKCSNPIACP
jgi:hypothetical protein